MAVGLRRPSSNFPIPQQRSRALLPHAVPRCRGHIEMCRPGNVNAAIIGAVNAKLGHVVGDGQRVLLQRIAIKVQLRIDALQSFDLCFDGYFPQKVSMSCIRWHS
jgi:hypothetical protein